MQYRQLDLHLLEVFEALMTERNVTRAAERVHLSQSATSKALARLREQFGDALFLRAPGGVAPTHRALELAPRIRRAVGAAAELLNEKADFDPSQALTVFNVAASDYIAVVVLPQLVPLLNALAPRTRLAVHDLSHFTAEDMLLSGRADLVLASVPRVSRPLHRLELFRDEYVCVARATAGSRSPALSLDDFVTARHLVVPRQNGGGMSVVDDALALQSLSREVALSVPHLTSIADVLAASDLLVTVPARIAAWLVQRPSLQVHAHPLALAPFVVSQIWHGRTDDSPAHIWLRSTIARLGQQV